MQKKVIVIGSGIGGLSAATALAKKGYKVKVLEATNVVGGYCQSFKRKGFKFITSVHKTGDKGWTKKIDKFVELLSDGDEKVKWKSFNEYHVFDDVVINQCSENIEEELIEYFPYQEKEIKKFFEDFRRLFDIMCNVFSNNMSISKLAINDAQFYLTFINKTIEDILNEYFNDNLLKNIILSSTGLERDSIALTIPPALFENSFNGEFYIVEDGFDKVIDILIKIIKENNGEILKNKRVEKIVIENGKVTGVISNGEFEEADYIVSGMDIWKTYNDMIGNEYVDQKYIDMLDKKWKSSNSSYGLWIGLDCSLEELGIKDECIYYYPDREKSIEIKEKVCEENGKIINGFPIMINSHFSTHEGCTPKGKSQLSIGFIASYSLEENWGIEDGRRGEKYKNTKARVRDMVLDILEKRIPNIRDHIEVIVDATPITYERYSGNRRGAYTGYRKKSSYILDKNIPSNKGKVDGLYFSSHWVSMQGSVLYTFLQGFNTANLILKNEGRNDFYNDNDLIKI